MEEHDYCYEVYTSYGSATQEEQELLQASVKSILCYKGVTAEDIQNRSVAFEHYVNQLLLPEIEKLRKVP